MGEYKKMEAKLLKKQGMQTKKISEALQVDRRTVYNYLNDRVFTGRKRGRPRGSKKLQDYKRFIKSELARDFHLNSELLYEKLLSMGYTGGISILRDFVRATRKDLSTEAVIRFESMPGLQAQVDWFETWRYENGKRRKRYAFIMKLGYSRRSFITFTDSMDQTTLLLCHILAFRYFGGIPSEILYDNMRTVFQYNKESGRWETNYKFLAFAAHYGFIPLRCRVYRPQTKGKVEREVRYLRSSFLPLYRNIQDINNEELNDHVLSWLKHVDKKHLRQFNESRIERFREDKKYLNPLPASDYECRKEVLLNVRRDGLITFKANFYSMSADYIGKILTCLHNPLMKTLAVYYEDKHIRNLNLFPDGYNKKLELPSDKESLFKRWRHDRARRERRRLQNIEKKKRIAEHKNSIQTPDIYDKIFKGSTMLKEVPA